MTTLMTPLRRAEQIGAGQTAIVCGEERLSYAETGERCRRLTAALRGLGAERGERIAIVAQNCHRYAELLQAVPGAGLVVVPLNARHTAEELCYALGDSGAKVLFASTEAAFEAAEGLVERVFDMGPGYESLLAAAAPEELPADVAEDDLAGLFYTGGTTGASKGVMLSHRNLIANALSLQARWTFDEKTRWLVAAPMFHAAGTLAGPATVWNAGTQVILPQFDPAAALDLIEREGVTHTLLVPTMLAALAEEQAVRPRRVERLKGIAHGGAPVASETLRRAHAAFPGATLMEIYGATETSPIATMLPAEEELLERDEVRSCGRPAVGVEVSALGADGAPVPLGEIGEIAIRGANVMSGYWNKPEQTAAVLVDGWYRSGDLGYQDENGYFYLVDRAKDMIVSGGENVYSTEVEEALYRHPAVAEAAVFGIPDATWGEAVHAVVVLRTEVDPEALREHCRALIADYKVPRRVELREQPLPKSAAGKLLKRELRDVHWHEQAGAVGGS